MDDQMQYPWQQAIVDAFLSAPADAPMKIKIAERTISDRLKESRPMDSSERIALQDGQRALRVLLSETRAEAAEYRLRPTQQPFLTPSNGPCNRRN